VEFVITSNQIMGFCSLVAGLYGVWKIVKELKKPSDDLKKEVERHSELLDNDNKRLKEVETSSKMILQTLLVIVNHDITSNGYEELEQARDDLQEFLINK
jgi:hypothetical protein